MLSRWCAVLCSLFISLEAFAFDWGVTHLTYLRGQGYEFPGGTTENLEIYTFEHVNGTSWGDTFLFIDVENASRENPGHYFEFNPRISSKKTLNIDYGSGLLSDILFAAQYNDGKSANPIYLYGIAVDLNLPGFKFFQTHFYSRDDRLRDGTSTQLTLVWNMEFDVGAKLEFGGFLDYATAEGKDDPVDFRRNRSEANLLAQPFLLVKLHEMLAVGIEYQYWSNKYGIKDLTESLPQYMLRVNF